ncbi:MAG: type II toxin-antitoxin system HicB family antitoxin [Thermotogae bacterium]|nr:MAG: type II toxin-antitoxin system HicB family antitoxin [Thermotogota bacterium]
MKEFTVLIERDEDGWLIGSVIELPGCYTQAKTLDELMKRIKEAIEVYLDVQEIPQEKIEFVGVQKVKI